MITFIHPLTGTETFVEDRRAREYEALGFVRKEAKKEEPEKRVTRVTKRRTGKR